MVVPRPGSLSAVIEPPWDSTRLLAMASPSPAPLESWSLDEPVEYTGQIFRGDSGSRIPNREGHALPRLGQLGSHDDRASGGRVAYRVLKEVDRWWRPRVKGS